MAVPEINANRALVLYQGAPLEQIGTRALIFPGGQQQESRFFIPEDIVVGRYGVAGFVVVDKSPEDRWVTYTDSEWSGVGYREDEVRLRVEFEGANPTHFLHTDRGFKMIRYFVLSPQVEDFFAKDRFLGEPLIDKCCREGTLPEEFDEVPAHTNHAFGNAAFRGVEEDLIDAVIRTTFPDLTEEEMEMYSHGRNQYAYVSFHPWQEFKYVIGEGQNSIYAAISNFDEVIGRFDTKQLLTPRDLRVTSADNPQIQAAQ